MNPERMQLKGQLAEAKKKFNNLDMEASGLIVLIRNYINPFLDDVTALQVDEAHVSMHRLQTIISEMKALKEKIEKLEEAVG